MRSAAAQLRVELGAGAGSTPVASPLGSPADFGQGARLSFRPTWAASADATLWFGVVGLRANGVFAKKPLGSDVFAGDVNQSVDVLSGSADIMIPFLYRRPSYLFSRRFAYVAFGGGVRQLMPTSGEPCAVRGESSGCGTLVRLDSGAFLVARSTQPMALAAFGARIPFGAHSALRFEVGDRAARSPLVALRDDGAGGYARGPAVRTLVHEPYAQLSVHLLAGRGPSRQPPPLLPRLEDASGSNSGNAAPADPAATYLSFDARVDTLVRRPAAAAAESKPARARSVAPVAAVQPVDSVKPRAPGNDGMYDVVLDVPNVSVDEITLEVDNLQAHVSLDAKVAKLVSLNVGADAGIERVYLGIRGVQAQAHLKVDLDNVATIVDRVLTTIDRNPEIITGLLETLDKTVSTVGTVANTALQPGGVVSQAVETVGNVANTALQPGGVVSEAVRTVGDVASTALQPGGAVTEAVRTVGDVANSALLPNGLLAQTVQTLGGVANTALAPNGLLAQTVNTVGDVANATLQPGGVVGQVVGVVGGTLQNVTGQGGLLSAQGIDALGQTVVRVVDGSGQILQRTLDRAGGMVGQNVVGNVLQLPLIGQVQGGDGRIYRTVRDASGALILLTLDAAERLIGIQVLQQATGVVAPLVSPGDRQPDTTAVRVIIRPPDSPSDAPVIPQGRGGPWMDFAEYSESVAQIRDTVPPPPGASRPTGAANPPRSAEALVLGVTLNSRGHTVQRVIESTGGIYERTIDPSTGRVLSRKGLGSVLQLGAVRQQTLPTGELVRVVRDASGAVLELGFNPAGVLGRIRLLQMGDLGSASLKADAPLGVRNDGIGEALTNTASSALNGVTAVAQSAAASAGLRPSPTGASPSTGLVSTADVRRSIAPAAAAAADPTTADTAQQLLLGQTVNEQGQLVLRLVDIRGNVTERYLNAAGQLVVRRRLTSVRLLPPLREYVDVSGRYIRIVRDELGSLLELTFSPAGRLTRLRLLQQPASATATGEAQPTLTLLAQTTNRAGQFVQRTVESTGRIVERTVDAAGKLLQQRELGNVLQLPALSAIAQASGQLVVIARDPSGALLEVLLRASDRAVMGVRALDAIEKR